MSVTPVRRDLVRSAEWHRVRDFAQQVLASPARRRDPADIRSRSGFAPARGSV